MMDLKLLVKHLAGSSFDKEIALVPINLQLVLETPTVTPGDRDIVVAPGIWEGIREIKTDIIGRSMGL